MTVFDDVMAKAAVEGPFCAVNTQQAGMMVHLSVSALKSQRLTSRREPDGKAKIPFQRRGGKVVYAVTDLLEYAKRHNSNGLSAAERTLALLMGDEFCKRIGEPWPAHQAPRAAFQPPRAAFQPPSSSVADEGATESRQGVSEAPVMAEPPGLAALFGMFGGASSAAPRKRGPKSMKAENARIKALTDMGVAVQTNRCLFASLQDFLLNADPDEEWLFCRPADRRPYDFIQALLCGPTDEPFEWMSLSGYLESLARWSANEKEAREAAEEAEQIFRSTEKVLRKLQA
jgi:hypothetical protein